MPASAPQESTSIQDGISALTRRGLHIRGPIPQFEPVEYLAGSDEDRTSQLNYFLDRSDVSALFAVRGGYGAMRILDAIDYDLARNHAKLLVGYSDITALHFAFYTKAGWSAVAGPMVAVDWPTIDEDAERQFWDLCEGAVLESLALPGDEAMRSLSQGDAEGILLGGNLATVVRLLGTPYLPSLRGAILFLEDIGEAPYRIDALLAQLRLSGELNHLSGVVLGRFSDCLPVPGKRSFSIDEVFQQYFSDAPFPVATGFNFGHHARKISVPFGIRARLEAAPESAVLSMLEPVVGPS